jgi:hypothetical protein
LTESVTAWVAAINALGIGGGGDGPEAQWDGIACATDIDFCPTGNKYSTADCGFTSGTLSRKVLVVTTDAAFSNDSDIQNRLASTTTALNNAGVILIGLKAPGAGTELNALASNTGGSVQPLSSNGANIAAAILAGLSVLPTAVTHDVTDCTDKLLSVVVTPPSQTVQSGTDAEFEETIGVDNPVLAGTTVICEVDFLDNGVLAGTQTITVTVPLSVDATPDTDTNPLCTSHTVNTALTSGGTPMPGANVTVIATSGPNQGVSNTVTIVSDGSGLASFTYFPLQQVSAGLGIDMIDVCSRGVCDTVSKTWALEVDASPNAETNELSEDSSHTVTAVVTSDATPLDATDVGFQIVLGPNAGGIVTKTTDASGTASFSYSTPVSCSSLGTDSIEACVCGICETVYKSWEDTTLPIASCVPGANPAGNEPAANNQDGFFTVSGSDDVATITQVELIDMGSGYSFGFFDIDTAIKYVQAPGAPPKIRESKGEVDWQITGNGDLKVEVTDCAGNVGEAFCLVPPPSDRRL